MVPQLSIKLKELYIIPYAEINFSKNLGGTPKF